MAIMVKIKPVKVEAKTKQEAINKVRGYSIWNRPGGHFDNYARFLLKNGIVRLYSLEKRNRKVEVSKRTITRGKQKGEVEVTRKVIRESGWVAHYYDLPIDMVDIKATHQNNRNFTLKLKV